VNLHAGDRILVKNQANASENGIYVVPSNVSTPWARSADADNTPNSEVNSGMYVFATEGFTNKGTGWIMTTATDSVVLGTTALDFVQFTGLGQVTAGAGLTSSGNQIDIGAGNGILVLADTIAVKADGTTLEATPTSLHIKDAGVGTTQLTDLSVTASKLNSDVAGSGITQNASGAISANTDNSSITIAGNKIQIKDSGVTPAKLDASVAGAAITVNSSTGALDVNAGYGLTVNAGQDRLDVQAANNTIVVAASGIKLLDVPQAHILIGNAGSVAVAQSISGDISITESGVVTVNSNTVMTFDKYVVGESPNTSDNQVYTLAHTPIAGTLLLMVNGEIQDVGASADYTIVDSTITFSTANESVDKVRATYFRA
jgi:hypothetical protein